MPRSWWWTVSATTTSYPTSAATSGRQQAQAVGLAEATEAADHPVVAVELDHLVVARVGDEHVPVVEADRLGREAEVGRLDRRRHVRRVPGLERALRPVLLDQVGEQRVDRVGVALPGVLRDDVPLGVDEHERRPRAGGVGLPGDQLGVVEHGVVDRVALDRLGQRHRVGLVHELRRVDADHDQLVGVLLLHRAQLVEDVQAVHAAEGPEIEQQEATAQVLQ